MRAGIGYSNKKDSFLSGREVAEKALQNGSIQRADVVFAFCGGNVDHEEFYQGLREIIVSEVPIIGGSALGIITNHDISYKGYPAGAAVIQSDKLHFRVAVADNLDKGEKQAGTKVTEQLLPEPDDRLLTIFYDSVKKPSTETTPPILNASLPIIEGIEGKLRSKVPVIGAGLVGDYLFNPTKQFCGSSVRSQSVVGLMVSGEVEPYCSIMHGCTPLDGVYHTITKSEGSIIYEVDKKPVVEMIDSIYENQNWRNEHPVKLISIGVNYGPRYGKPNEAEYVNRLITGALPGGEGIGIFEPDLENGVEIQFMLRDSGEMIKSARVNSEDLMKQIESDGRKAFFGLYIDCAGRTADYSNTMTEEASEVQKVLNRYEIPLLGFYSGVEIAPLIGKSRGLDWTGVLVVFAEGYHNVN